MTESDPTLTAGLLALAMGLLKVLESVITWAFKKMTAHKEKPTVVQLAPEATQMLRDIHIVSTRVNEEGVPLIYGPRAEMHHLAAALDATHEKLDQIGEQADDIFLAINKKNQ